MTGGQIISMQVLSSPEHLILHRGQQYTRFRTFWEECRVCVSNNAANYVSNEVNMASSPRGNFPGGTRDQYLEDLSVNLKVH